MADDNTFDATQETAVLLLGAAADLGLDRHVVQLLDGRLTAPEEVIKKAGVRKPTAKPVPTEKAPEPTKEK